MAEFDAAAVEAALAEAHIPSLLLALIHLTGDTTHLDSSPLPVYEMWGDGQGGLPADLQARVREEAKWAIARYLERKTLPPAPDAATVRRMMEIGNNVPAGIGTTRPVGWLKRACPWPSSPGITSPRTSGSLLPSSELLWENR